MRFQRDVAVFLAYFDRISRQSQTLIPGISLTLSGVSLTTHTRDTAHRWYRCVIPQPAQARSHVSAALTQLPSRPRIGGRLRLRSHHSHPRRQQPRLKSISDSVARIAAMRATDVPLPQQAAVTRSRRHVRASQTPPLTHAAPSASFLPCSADAPGTWVRQPSTVAVKYRTSSTRLRRVWAARPETPANGHSCFSRCRAAPPLS